MATLSESILLGDVATVSQLFSYPNIPGSSESLEDTVLHWIKQTIARDGLDGRIMARVVISTGQCVLVLDGDGSIKPLLDLYAARLPAFLANGLTALRDNIPSVPPAIWDPGKDGWRFFLPLGLPMVSQRSVQFFHFPPMGLLNPLRDYLNDPVPIRWGELLIANGYPPDEIFLLETIVDAAPVAASDNQGTQISKMLVDTQDYFQSYHLPQLQLLTTRFKSTPFTTPLVVLGSPARAVVKKVFGVDVGVNQTASLELLKGFTTPILGTNHPYYFYITAQGSDSVGSGKILPSTCARAKALMIQDLISAGWQAQMARDPTRNSQQVLDERTRYWNDPASASMVCALTQRHGSLFYIDKDPTKFVFNLSLEAALAYCAAHGQDPCAG